MGDDVAVLHDEIEAYDDGEIARVRLLSVPTSSKFPEGIKSAFHYGEAGAEHRIIRFDNHHGVHELHLDSQTFVIDFPGVQSLFRAGELFATPEKRVDW